MRAYLSTTGQVSIPLAVREAAGIGPGSAVDIRYQNGQVILQAADDAGLSSGRRAVAALRRAPVKPRQSTEEILALTRDWTADGPMP